MPLPPLGVVVFLTVDGLGVSGDLEKSLFPPRWFGDLVVLDWSGLEIHQDLRSIPWFAAAYIGNKSNLSPLE